MAHQDEREISEGDNWAMPANQQLSRYSTGLDTISSDYEDEYATMDNTDGAWGDQVGVYDGHGEEFGHQPETERPNVKDEIKRLRGEFFDLINSQSPEDEFWNNEKAWGKSDGDDKLSKITNDLVKMDENSLVPTVSDPSPMNFLQNVLKNIHDFHRGKWRLQRAKFALHLITRHDSTQLNPKWDPKPLHTAAEFDIKHKDDHQEAVTCLTVYLCSLMSDELAAEKTCELNEASENILHLVIRYDLAGADHLINRAGNIAFGQHRRSLTQNGGPKLDDGNTPLHDALEFETKFLLPRERCQARYPSIAAVRTPDKPIEPTIPAGSIPVDRLLSSAGNRQIPNSSSIHMNQGRARGAATTPTQGPNLSSSDQHGPTSPMPQPCQQCLKAHGTRLAAFNRRFKIIEILIEKNKDVLSSHNTCGLSPYLNLLAQRENYLRTNGKGDTIPQSMVSQVKSYDNMSRVHPAYSQMNQHTAAPDIIPESPEPSSALTTFTKPGQERPGRQNKEHEDNHDKSPVTPSEQEQQKQQEEQELEKKKLKKQKQNMSQAELPSNRRERSSQPPANNHSYIRSVASKPAFKNSINRYHSDDDLLEAKADIGADIILADLKERSFSLGSFRKALECLFRNNKAVGPSPFQGEQNCRRKLSLEGNQRVTSKTADDFNFLLFEHTMSSVVLSLEYTPDEIKQMDINPKERLKEWQENENGLLKVFKWLREKKVKCILNLTVKDNPYHYCSDYTVKECLKDLEVRYLNWNRPDLCGNTETLPKDLIEVSLYWSGLDAILWSWSDTQGLRTLTKLQKIQLYVLRAAEPEEQQNDRVEAFKQRVKGWGREKALIIDRLDDDRHIRNGTKSGGVSAANARTHPWLECVQKFTMRLRGDHRDKFPVGIVKVALLDDGVDPTYTDNNGSLGASLYYAGWPSEDSGELEQGLRSFYVSSNQHGSKMASLIRKVCPFVSIHVAKMDVQNVERGVHHRTFKPRQAIEAIKWAISQKVDIISMSWNICQVLGEGSNEKAIQLLEDTLKGAADANILLFGAACNVKRSTPQDKWMPCDHDRVFSIGAADLDFDAKKYVDMSKKVNFLFPSDYVLDEEDVDTGNSGATALASGLAALVIACTSTDYQSGFLLPENNRRVWMDNIMTKVFNGSLNDKKVRVDHVLKVDDDNDVTYLSPLVNKFTSHLLRSG